jgi:hypothetical protein
MLVPASTAKAITVATKTARIMEETMMRIGVPPTPGGVGRRRSSLGLLMRRHGEQTRAEEDGLDDD